MTEVEFFDAMVARARAQGFKPGYAAAQYKTKYGAFPPPPWCHKVNVLFAKDESWQRAVSIRDEERSRTRVNDPDAPPGPPAPEITPEMRELSEALSLAAWTERMRWVCSGCGERALEPDGACRLCGAPNAPPPPPPPPDPPGSCRSRACAGRAVPGTSRSDPAWPLCDRCQSEMSAVEKRWGRRVQVGGVATG
jgi:hypothetical protein